MIHDRINKLLNKNHAYTLVAIFNKLLHLVLHKKFKHPQEKSFINEKSVTVICEGDQVKCGNQLSVEIQLICQECLKSQWFLLVIVKWSRLINLQ